MFRENPKDSGSPPRALRLAALISLVVAIQLSASSQLAFGSPAQPPANTAPPSISGLPKPDQILTALPGEWAEEPSEFQFRWEICDPQGSQCKLLRDFGPDPSYVVQPRDVLGYVRVQVRAVNLAGSSEPVASALEKIEMSWEWIEGPPRVEAVRWSGWPCCRSTKVPSTKALDVSVPTGYCVEEPPPELDHISVIERPETAKRQFKSAVITVFTRFPRPTEVLGTVHPGEPVPGCAGIGTDVSGRVKLKRPVERLFLFDGKRRPYRLVRRPHGRGAPSDTR